MSGAGQGADSVQVRAVRAARALAAASGREEVCAALEAAAAHLDDGSAAGAAGAYVVVREARRLAGAAAAGPLADALDVALATINAARLGGELRLPPNPGPLPAGYAAPAAYVRVEPLADDSAAAIVRALAAADPLPLASRPRLGRRPRRAGGAIMGIEAEAEEILLTLVRCFDARNGFLYGVGEPVRGVRCYLCDAFVPFDERGRADGVHSKDCPAAQAFAYVLAYPGGKGLRPGAQGRAIDDPDKQTRIIAAWLPNEDAAAHDADPDPEPPLYDDGPGGEPWQGAAR